jgi:hypothetical protein
MRIIISESQYRILKESKNKKAITAIIEEMGLLGASEFLGIPVYRLIEMGVVKSYDDLWLDLQNTPIESLGNLKYVDGGLILSSTSIKNLGNLEEVGDFLDLSNSKIESLGNLEKVGGYLDLQNTPIESLGNLKYVVGGYLNLEGCPLAKLSDEEIKSQVKIKGKIYR